MDFDATEQVNALAKLPPEPVKPEKRSAWNLVHTIPRAAVAESAAGAIEIGVMGARSLAQIRDATPEQRKQIDAEGVSGVSGKNDVSASLRNVAEDLRPDPATASKAEQIVFDLGRIVTKAIGYGVTLGPIAIPALAADEGLSETDRLQRQDVDDATARDAGGVNAAATALGALIPVAGAGRGFTAANVGKVVGLAAASGPTTFVAQQKITSEILSRANYGDIAAQYDPLDPTGLALSTLAPLIFGGMHLRGGKVSAKAEPVHETAPVDQTPAAPKVADMPPEAVDAAMVHNLTLQQDVHESTHPAAGVAEVMRPHVTETPEFKAWFGESKVTDAEGKPLVVYHGTRAANIEEFETGAVSRAIYASDDPSYASSIAGLWKDSDSPTGLGHMESGGKASYEGANLIPIYVRSSSMLDLSGVRTDRKLTVDEFASVLKDAGVKSAADVGVDFKGDASRRGLSWWVANTFNLESTLKSSGFDGVKFRETFKPPLGVAHEASAYAVFDPNQIKSAIGNSGKFDPNSASLTDPVAAAKFRLPEPSSLSTPDAPSAEVMARSGRVETVPIADIAGTQSTRQWAKFDAGDHPGPLIAGYGDKPVAVRMNNGEYLVFDGHHRVERAAQSGAKHVEMHVVDAKDYDPANAGKKRADVSTHDDDALMAALTERELNPKDAINAHMRSVTDRVAAVEAAKPDAPVAIDAEGKRISTAEELDRARHEAAEGTDFELGALDADLLRIAADCALTLG